MRKQNLIIAIVALLGISLLGGCSGSQYQKQLDLGYKYLQEEKYEEAIVAMNKAIDIDDKRPEAYIGLGSVFVTRCDENTVADVSVALKKGYEKSKSDLIVQAFLDLADQLVENGKSDWAINLLDFGFELTDNKKIDTKVKELRQGLNPDDNIIESEESRIKKVQHYNADGTSEGYGIPEYNDKGNILKWNYYDKAGTLTAYEVIEYDKDGRESKATYFDASDTLTSSAIPEHDDNGKTLKWTNYDIDGTLSDYEIHDYDKDERESKVTYYEADGTSTGYYGIPEYDQKGRKSKWTVFDSDGTISVYSIFEY